MARMFVFYVYQLLKNALPFILIVTCFTLNAQETDGSISTSSGIYFNSDGNMSYLIGGLYYEFEFPPSNGSETTEEEESTDSETEENNSDDGVDTSVETSNDTESSDTSSGDSTTDSGDTTTSADTESDAGDGQTDSETSTGEDTSSDTGSDDNNNTSTDSEEESTDSGTDEEQSGNGDEAEDSGTETGEDTTSGSGTEEDANDATSDESNSQDSGTEDSETGADASSNNEYVADDVLIETLSGLFKERDSGLESNILVYPNPFLESVFVRLPHKPENDTEYRVYDVSGRLLVRDMLLYQSNTLDLNRLPKGIFFIMIYNVGMGSKYFKLLKK